MTLLSREEIVEQAYFFHTLRERLEMNIPLQDLLASLREEVLSTTRLPMAIDFLLSELMHEGLLAPAMRRLEHYFTPFQTYVFEEAENDQGRFDIRIGLEILATEADYRAKDPTQAGIFLYHFETICRNRLRYDHGLTASSGDPVFDENWRDWILVVRRQIGIRSLADLVYVRSEHFANRPAAELAEEKPAVLFGVKEGKLALANRDKEPLLLLSALQRHLGYPAVPRPQRPDPNQSLVPQLARRIEQLETRLKLLEDEQKDGSIDITHFYGKQ